MKCINHSFQIAVLILSLHVSAHAQQYYGNQEDIDQILVNIDLFSQYFIQGDHVKMTECYTEKAKILPSGPAIIEGKDNIANFWKAGNENKTIHHKIIPQEIRITEGYAYDMGYYEGATRNASGQVSNWQGKYVIIWKKVDNEWKIYIDIWNRLNEPIASN